MTENRAESSTPVRCRHTPTAARAATRRSTYDVPSWVLISPVSPIIVKRTLRLWQRLIIGTYQPRHGVVLAAPGGDLDLVPARIVKVERVHGHERVLARAQLEAQTSEALAFRLEV